MKQIYLHGEGLQEIKLVEVAEDLTTDEILSSLRVAGATFLDTDEVYIFIDEEEPFDGKKIKVKHKQHVHVSRCKKVQVTIMYNTSIVLVLPPNTKISKLIRLAAKQLSISDNDSADLIPMLGANTLDANAHIGAYVTKGTCSVSISLIPNTQVKG